MTERLALTALERVNLAITNSLLLVPYRVRRYKEQHPSEKIVAAGATKAQKKMSDKPVQYEAGWVFARRGILILTERHLKCGNWIIPLETIKSCILQRFNTLMGRGLVLKVETDAAHYQFGLQYDPVWLEQSVLPLTVVDTQIRYSLFSIVIRLLLLACILWLILENLR